MNSTDLDEAVRCGRMNQLKIRGRQLAMEMPSVDLLCCRQQGSELQLPLIKIAVVLDAGYTQALHARPFDRALP